MPVTSAASAPSMTRASELLPELRELFAYTLEVAVITQLGDEAELAAETRAIAAAVRGVGTLQDILASIKRLAYRLEFLAEDRGELNAGLIKLLQLMIDNVSELVVDDRWLNGQIDMVREIVARPLNTRSATTPATQRSSTWSTSAAPRCARRTPSPASAARSSSSCCRTRRSMTRARRWFACSAS